MTALLWGEPIAVHHLEGEVHGFLVLRAQDGALVANGESLQVTKGDRVTNRLVYHFKDGSVSDETVVFSQKGHFRLLSDHLVQKGPAFKHPMDVSVDGATGMVTVRAGDKTETTHVDLPPDLSNGMVPVLLKNLGPGAQSAELSMLVATPKPMLVKLLVTPQGEDSFVTGGASHKATRFTSRWISEA